MRGRFDRSGFSGRIAPLLIAIALTLRLFVPEGWMPTTGQGFAITMCSGTGAESVWVDADGKIHKHAPEAPGDSHCAFAGLGAPALGGDVPALRAPATADDGGVPIASMVAAVGRGLAAPPPPATGPPAIV